MLKPRNLTIAILLVLLLVMPVYAGSLNPPGDKPPDDVDTKMYTLEQIYHKVADGDTTGKHGAQFYEPAAGPGATMHTLDDIYAKIVAGTTTAVNTDVLSGKTFITRTGSDSGEAMVTGTLVPSGDYGLPKTGQTESYQDYDDGWYEKGWVGTRFTPTDAGKTVTDNATGLIWVKDPSTLGGVWGKKGEPLYTWSDAITNCEALEYAGKDDWRLPNIKELMSIVDYGRSGPAIDPVFTSQSYNYWSSTAPAGTADYVWTVNFTYGNVFNINKDDGYCYVRPVRGGQ